MANNPFTTLVGLRGVSDAATTWVNDISGMSTELVANLAQPSDLFGSDATSTDAGAVWESVHRNAYAKLLNEVLLLLSENYDFQPVIARTVEPQRAKPATTLNGSGLLLGVVATMPYEPNSIISLHSLTVFVMPNGDPNNQGPFPATVSVYDADTNAHLYSGPQSFHFGVNTIELNQTFRTLLLEPLRLAVLVNSSYLWLTELSVPGWNNCTDSYLIEGVRTVNPSNLTEFLLPEKTYMSLDIEVTRTLDSLMPRFAADLSNAYAYLCASLLMTEKLASPNISVFTLSNLQFTERMESKLFDDFKRALRPIVRRLSNELLPQQALSIPVATPDEITYIQGSYV